jgi:hypothetical protein
VRLSEGVTGDCDSTVREGGSEHLSEGVTVIARGCVACGRCVRTGVLRQAGQGTHIKARLVRAIAADHVATGLRELQAVGSVDLHSHTNRMNRTKRLG